mgnify:CR=1 FL=1
MDICSSVLNAQVPSMLLQPLVENAIKFAIEPNKLPGTIIIMAKHECDRLVLKIIDDGEGIKPKSKAGFGIGLTNTKARLDAMFNNNYEINISQGDNKGTEVYISIPFEK